VERLDLAAPTPGAGTDNIFDLIDIDGRVLGRITMPESVLLTDFEWPYVVLVFSEGRYVKASRYRLQMRP
jgi:hypothetical protein